MQLRTLVFASRPFTLWKQSQNRQIHSLPSLRKSMETDSENKTTLTRFESVDLNEVTSPKTDSRNIEFGNQVFREKSTWEIIRALTILKACSFNVFVDNSLSIMKWTRRILGSIGLRILFKPTLYNQFVGGETRQEIQKCLRKLSETGIRPMLAATLEEDIEDTEGTGNEDIYDSNCARILECMEIATAENNPAPMMQLKMTGLLSADLVVLLSDMFLKCNSQLELVKDIAQEMLSDQDVSSNNLKNTLDIKKLTQLKKALNRLRKIGKEATQRGVKVLVDAEYTYMNPGLSLLTLAMCQEYNKSLPVIWNTYQCYLKNAREKVLVELKLADQMKVSFGAKLVRGAYVTQEREKSKKMGTEDPICVNYQATSENYNGILCFLLQQVKEKGSSKCTFIVASHNEESVKLTIDQIEELGIDKEIGGVCFGQLYGMCDQVTYPLAGFGYAVYKSIPYGTVEEVLPYLSRRAMENKAVIEGCRKERSLLWEEFKDRLLLKHHCHRTT